MTKTSNNIIKKYEIRRQMEDSGLFNKSEDILFSYIMSKQEDLKKSFYEYDGKYVYFKTSKTPVVTVVSKQFLADAITETYFDARAFGISEDYFECKNKIAVVALAKKSLCCLPDEDYLSTLFPNKLQLVDDLANLCDDEKGIESCLSIVQLVLFQLVKQKGIETEK